MRTDLDLAAIRARCDAATPGPWAQGMAGYKLLPEVDYHAAFGFIIVSDDLSDDGQRGVADAAFIAHAREDVPALLAENERLREALVAARAELSCWGWGDIHYGATFQEQRVVDALAAVDAVLHPQEPSGE
ncbi:MAG: hypothetical protein M0Z46_10635 [Actinomycetota bacterium]|jgi:hypothetical protein|nr:hypothetical protein [Actinomycetota bacterium]